MEVSRLHPKKALLSMVVTPSGMWIIPNACHAIWDGDGGEAGAIFESVIPDASHIVGDVNSYKASAIPKSTIPYALHSAGDSDRY